MQQDNKTALPDNSTSLVVDGEPREAPRPRVQPKNKPGLKGDTTQVTEVRRATAKPAQSLHLAAAAKRTSRAVQVASLKRGTDDQVAQLPREPALPERQTKPRQQKPAVRPPALAGRNPRLVPGLGIAGALQGLNMQLAMRDRMLQDALAAKELHSLTELRLLALAGLPLNGTGLERLRGLQELDLRNKPVNDRSVVPLTIIPELSKLQLAGTKVTGPGLRQLTSLTELDLSNTPATDKSIAVLKSLPDLRVLRLRGTNVGGPGLADLKGLRELDLSGTRIDDQGLEHLKGMRELRQLNLSGTHVTDAGVRTLQQALPGVRITR
jgi:Leucine-rich repeat (LRR) protein